MGKARQTDPVLIIQARKKAIEGEPQPEKKEDPTKKADDDSMEAITKYSWADGSKKRERLYRAGRFGRSTNRGFLRRERPACADLADCVRAGQAPSIHTTEVERGDHRG